MALTSATYLAVKSAVARLKIEAVSDRLRPMLQRGDVATCSIVDLELLFSARSHADHEAIRANRSGYELITSEQRDFDRAIEIQGLLTERNRHRQISIPDLLIVAVAEKASLTVLHYDADFDLLAEVSGASTEWVVPRGTI